MKNKRFVKGSSLTEKIIVTAFTIAAGAAVIAYMSDVLITHKQMNNAGILDGFEGRNRIIADSEGTEGLVYTLNGNQYSVTGYEGSSEDVVVPSTHLDLPVTKIGSAFGDNHSLKSITVGYGVEEIGSLAFNRCSLLSSVSLPDSVLTLKSGCFQYCTSLTSIRIPDSVTQVESFGAFYNCSKLSSVHISKNLSKIASGMFASCYALESIQLPEGVTTIDSQAFESCNKLASINIPTSVTSIDTNAFKFCVELDSIYIPSSVTTMNKEVFMYADPIVNCQPSSKPSGWSNDWDKNGSDSSDRCTVNWGVR